MKFFKSGIHFFSMAIAMSTLFFMALPAYANELSTWGSREKEGYMEHTIKNRNGDAITFACDEFEEVATFLVPMRIQSDWANVDIRVDDRSFDFLLWPETLELNSDCRECGNRYADFLEAVERGAALTVMLTKRKPIRFDISQAQRVLTDKMCEIQ